MMERMRALAEAVVDVVPHQIETELARHAHLVVFFSGVGDGRSECVQRCLERVGAEFPGTRVVRVRIGDSATGGGAIATARQAEVRGCARRGA